MKPKKKRKEQKGNKKNDKYYDRINDDRDYSSKEYNRLLVVLSTGALTLSVGFIKNIVQFDNAIVKPLLFLAWSIFALSLISTLLSHSSAVKALDSVLDKKKCKIKQYDNLTRVLNWISSVSLIIGIILCVCFVIINLS